MAKRAAHKLLQPVAFVADVHLGNFKFEGGPMIAGLNKRGLLTLDTLALAMKMAREEGCSHFVVGGDLFHNRRPEPAVVAGAQGVFENEDRIQVVTIPGNHDTIEATALYGNTACAPMKPVADVVDGWKDVRLGEHHVMRLVPFEASKPMAQFLDEVCSNFRAQVGTKALMTHVGVVDDQSPPWLREARDAIEADKLLDIMEREDISLTLVGNYHNHREWERKGRRIIQVGALNPTGFSDEGFSDVGGLVIWDGAHATWSQVPGPRFATCKTEDKELLCPDYCTLFTRNEEAKEQLEQIKEAKVLANDAEDALARWCAANAPKGVDKVALLDQLRGYWKAAS